MSESKLITIDAEYLQPLLAACYLRVQGDEAAFIETNTAHSTPLLLRALEEAGLAAEQVRWIIVTHAHLDHAGGASALMEACPKATLVAHPRAARHLIDPTRLVASAEQVYGAAEFARLYGKISPIPAERVLVMEDGDSLPFGDATFRFLHTPGHAKHHMIVHDPARDTVFTGDTFGLAYPLLQRAGRFVIASTSPTDFDGPAAKASVDRVMSLGTRTACLTHFGEIDELDTAAAQLHRWLDLSEELEAKAVALPAEEAEPMIRAALEAEMDRAANERGLVFDAADRELLALDLGLNAQGLAFTAGRKRDASS